MRTSLSTRVVAATSSAERSSQIDAVPAGIDRSDVVATLNDLVASGFVVKQPDPADGRRNIITITEPGGRALDRLDAVLDDVQEAVLAPLDRNEREALVRLLAKIT